jgi:hypothetical protein
VTASQRFPQPPTSGHTHLQRALPAPRPFLRRWQECPRSAAYVHCRIALWDQCLCFQHTQSRSRGYKAIALAISESVQQETPYNGFEMKCRSKHKQAHSADSKRHHITQVIKRMPPAPDVLHNRLLSPSSLLSHSADRTPVNQVWCTTVPSGHCPPMTLEWSIPSDKLIKHSGYALASPHHSTSCDSWSADCPFHGPSDELEAGNFLSLYVHLQHTQSLQVLP